MMSRWMILLYLIAAAYIKDAFSQYENTDEKFCYAETKKPYLYFSSKTSYDQVYSRSNEETIPEECKLIQLWMVLRHGARYPLKKKMEDFQILEKLRDRIVHNHERHHRGELCEQDLQNLKAWSAENLPLFESDHLTTQGYDDMRNIGDRTWNRFPSLFKKPYSEQHYKIQYTNHVKTKNSAEAFTNGLFGPNIKIPVSTPQDLLTRIYPNCKVLPIPGADDLPDEGKNERLDFKEGPIMAEMVRNVSRRLGFTYSLSMDKIENMHDMCRYKKSWAFEDLSPWCACFLESDLKVLEYLGDISYYYNSGHGRSRNLRTGCPLVQDMIQGFRDLVVNKYSEQPTAVFYFGHSTTIYNLFARLGLAKDKVRLTHDNYYNMTNREWRTSCIGPFSSNFAAVLVRCSSGERNRVVFYLNESPLQFEECGGYVCPWDTLEEMYGNVTNPSTCNFNFCKENKAFNAQEENTTTTLKNIVNNDTNHSNDLRTGTIMTTVSVTKTQINNKNEFMKMTTERNNAIVKERLVPRNHKVSWDRILHRKVNLVTDNPSSIKIPLDNEMSNSDIQAAYLKPYDMNSWTYKPKTSWSDREMNLSWLFISILVCLVVLIMCNRYTWKRKQLKLLKGGYERMNSVQLRDFYD